jgi:hypothetical protein
VLDLVNPIRACWRLLGRGWQARLDKDWTKRSKESGQFMDQKEKGKFKGVRREK